VSGIGESLGLTSSTRSATSTDFPPTVKDFLSYCRLVKGTVASAAKTKGLRRAKLGNLYRRWAFGGATVIAKRDHAVIGPLAQRLEAVPVALLTPLGCQNRTARPTKFPKTLLHA